MHFRTLTEVTMIASADALPYPPEPVTRPGKFDTQDRKACRNDDETRAGQNQHRGACKHNSDADHTDHDPARQFVGDLNQASAFAQALFKNCLLYTSDAADE